MRSATADHWVGYELTTEDPGDRVTELHEIQVINEALAVIDRGLGVMQSRELVSTSEVADLLLDLRLLLMAAGEGAEASPALS